MPVNIINYFRLANLYQFEMDYAPADQIPSLMMQSMEYYEQAWIFKFLGITVLH